MTESPGIWLAVWVIMALSAAAYAWVLAFAANWAGHRKMPVVRLLILIWAWGHPAMTAMAWAALLIHGIRSPAVTSVVVGAGLAIVAWVWVLLAAVKPMGSDVAGPAPSPPRTTEEVPVIRFSSRPARILRPRGRVSASRRRSRKSA